MVKISVLYPNQPGSTFDEQYYLTQHMKLVTDLLGGVLKGAAVEKGVATAGGPAPYVFVAHMWFESMEALQSALNTHGAVLMADVPNYTNIQPVVHVGEVVFTSEPVVARAAN